MSLMSWFRDYVYIPLGGNRVAKWKWYFNIFFTFTLSGLWHGAGWGFILWGSLNGCCLIISDCSKSFREKWAQWVRLDRTPMFHKGFQIAFTFFLFCFTFVFFRSRTLSDALYTITHLGTGLGTLKGLKMSFRSFYNLGVERHELIWLMISIGLMELVEGIEPLRNMRRMFSERPILVRWAMYYVVILFLIFLGEYDDRAFIYFQF